MSATYCVSRRRFLRTAAIGSAGLVLTAHVRSQPANLPRKPNLLVFLPDQLRADAVFGENAGTVHAPNIHKLASQSVVFERAYVTHPICAPSRSSIFSGTWPHQNGCTNNQAVLPRKYLCLPEMIADSDYRTGYFGKWHLGDEFTAQHGFEEWASIDEYFKSAISDKKIEGVSDYGKFLISKGYKPDSGGHTYFGQTFVSTLPFELSKAKFVETKACEFLKKHRDDPFLLFVPFIEPHPPYNGPFNDEHPLDSISLDPSSGDTLGDDIPLRYRLHQELFKRRLGTPERYREVKQKYLGLITEMDKSVGAILKTLDDLGLTDRTITILSSDHGDMMSGHGILGKTLMFEQSARVPYVIRVPGQRPLRCLQPISHIDFAPTMLDLLGKPAHPQCAGQSQTNLIRGQAAAPGSIFLEWSPGREKIYKHTKLGSKEEIKQALVESTRAVVSPDGWKLCLRDKDKNEFYNLHDDPEERTNLYYKNTRLDVISRLTGEIHRWQEHAGDMLKV